MNLSNMNAFADRKSDFSKMIGFIFERVTNLLGKGENASSADPDIFLRGGPTENALVLLYDTLISGFQWM